MKALLRASRAVLFAMAVGAILGCNRQPTDNESYYGRLLYGVTAVTVTDSTGAVVSSKLVGSNSKPDSACDGSTLRQHTYVRLEAEGEVWLLYEITPPLRACVSPHGERFTVHTTNHQNGRLVEATVRRRGIWYKIVFHY